MTFRINEVDNITPQSNLIHKIFPDLVNNYVYYHQKISTGDNKLWDKAPPKYNNYQSIMDVKDSILQDPEKYIKDGPITVRCKSSMFYTCDSNIPKNDKLMGYDRLYKYDEITKKAGQYMLQAKGFSAKSDVLHGTVRWIYNDNGNIAGFVIVKDRGNLRTHIGIASIAGGDPELLITLDFHKNNPTAITDDLIRIESETFVEDAMDRRGFDSQTKFRAGYMAKRKSFVVQFEFLDKHLEVDYANVVNTERCKQGTKPHKYSLSSLAKLDFGKDGSPTGYITRYGKENICAAVKTIKKILDFKKDNKEISTSAVHTFCKTFHFLTSTPKDLGHKDKTSCKAITTRPKLMSELFSLFTTKTLHGKGKNYLMNLKALSISNSTKDTTWLAFQVYMDVLLKDLREINARDNDYRSQHPCISAYINDIGEKYNQSEAQKKVNL